MTNIVVMVVLFVGLTIFTFFYWYSIKNNERTIICHNEDDIIPEEDALYDAPTEIDRIGFMDYANAISSKLQENDSFIVYGIYGAWGSGKTSLMKMICNNLVNEKTIWFDAWKFKGKVSIFDALCQIMGKELSKEAISSYVPRNDNLKNWMYKNKPGRVKYDIFKIQQFKYNVKKLIAYVNSNQSKKIIVFIDDLDRCNPSNAIDFLENLKVFFDIPRLKFVIGVNYEVLINEVHKKYKSGGESEYSFSEEYLAKIINIPFFLPALDSKTIKRFIAKNISNPEIQYSKDVFAIGNDGSLRSVKRLINAYVTLLAIAKARAIEINPVLLAKIVVIQYRFREDYRRFVLEPDRLLSMQNSIHGIPRRNHRGVVVDNEDKDNNLIKSEIKAVLEIEPMFTMENVNMYITFVQSEDNTIKKDTVENYTRYLSDGKYDKIETLKYLPDEVNADLIKQIIDKFPKCNKRTKSELLRIMNTYPTEEGNRFQKGVILESKAESIDIRIESIEYLLKNGDNLEDYARRIVQTYQRENDIEKNYIMSVALTLIKYSQKYGIDIMLDIFNTINPDELKRNEAIYIISTLENSNDKKSVDILEQFINAPYNEITEYALNAIGKLDVDELYELQEQFSSDSKMYGKYISAIANNANSSSRIITLFKPEDIIEIIQNEDDPQDCRNEILMLKHLAIRRIRDWTETSSGEKEDDSLDVLLAPIIICLSTLERHAEHWTVREEATHTRSEIQEFRDRRIRFLQRERE